MAGLKAWAASLPGGRDATIPASRAMHQAAAENFAASFSELRGAMLKFGQILSFVDVPWLPAEYRDLYQDLLTPLQDSAHPMSFNQVRKIVESELGCGIGDVFSEFSRTPFAAASIGQVHMAISPAGKQLAVKVQYPGIDAAIRQDMQNLDLVTHIFELLSGPVRFPQASISRRLPTRCVCAPWKNLTTAGKPRFSGRSPVSTRGNARSAYRLSRPTFTTRRVLVSTWSRRPVGGGAAGAQRAADGWGEPYAGSLGEPTSASPLYGDPHPGTPFSARRHGSFLDFGCVRRFPPGDRARLRRLQVAAIDGDEARVRAACSALGILSEPIPDREARDLLAWMRLTALPLTTSALHGSRPIMHTSCSGDSLTRTANGVVRIASRISLPRDWYTLTG